MLDQEFLESIADCYSPAMGTENVGPLLYALARMTRPQRVLEIGSGYTSLFLLKALKDNASAIEQERSAPTSDADFRLASFYKSDFKSVLHSIDNNIHPDSTASRVAAAADRLDVSGPLQMHEADFQGYAEKIPAGDQPFDLIWFDCGNLAYFQSFAQEYFQRVDQNGGLVLIHSLATNMHGQLFMHALKLKQATANFNDFEIVTLVEPHKMRQNSLTMIRMTAQAHLTLHSVEP